MKKWISVPAAVIADDRLTDPELRMLLTLIAKVGRRFLLSESVLTKLAMSERTFYRLSKNLMQCQYLQHTPGIPEYCVLLPIMTAGCDKVGNDECQSWQSQEAEEERTKEEDNIYNKNSDFENEKDKENGKEKEIKKKEKPEEPDRFTEEYREIIGYLNEKTGKKFSARSRVNQGHMSARLKEGFTVEDFKRVIDIKCFQWLGDPKMAKFLRPETLFGTKFDRYLNEEKVVTRMGLHGEVYTVTEEEMNSPVPF